MRPYLIFYDEFLLKAATAILSLYPLVDQGYAETRKFAHLLSVVHTSEIRHKNGDNKSSSVISETRSIT